MRNLWKEEQQRDTLRDNTSKDDTVRDSTSRDTMRTQNDSLKEILKDKIWNLMLRDHTRRENTMRDIGSPQTPNPKTFLSSAAAAAKHNGETTSQHSLPHLRTQFPMTPTSTTPKTPNCVECEEARAAVLHCLFQVCWHGRFRGGHVSKTLLAAPSQASQGNHVSGGSSPGNVWLL